MSTLLPAWLQSLIVAHALADEGVNWFDDDERAQLESEIEEDEGGIYEHVLPVDDETLAAFDAELRAKITVATGPMIEDSLGGEHEAELWTEKDAPKELWLALSGNFPPSLWIPAGRDEASIRATMEGYFTLREEPGEENSKTKSVRLFLGVVPDFAELENRLTTGDFCDPSPIRLGSAAANEEDTTLLSIYRSLYSRSRIELEGFTQCQVGDLGMMVVGEIHYLPHAQTSLVRAYNERFGTSFPEHMPVDVIAALLGMPVLSADALLAQLAEEPGEGGDQPMWLLAYGLTCMNQARVAEALEPFAAHAEPRVRFGIANIALAFQLKEMLAEMAGREEDEELRELLEESLRALASGDGEAS